MIPRSLYRVTEDTDSRLVLVGHKFGLWFLAFFLLGNASVILYFGLFVMSRRQLFPVIAGALVGGFFALCGVAALVWAARYRSRIEVLRDRQVVRWQRGSRHTAFDMPFADIASIEIDRRRRSGSRGRPSTEYRVFMLDRDDGEWLIDRSTDGVKMSALADRLRALTTAAGAGGREATAEVSRRIPASAPEGIAVEAIDGVTTLRWRTLPRSAFWAAFWALLTLLLGGFTLVLVSALGREISRLPGRDLLIFAALAGLTLTVLYVVALRVRRRLPVSAGLVVGALWAANLLTEEVPFVRLGVAAMVIGYLAALSTFVLLAHCRLRVSADGLEYEERILGRPLGWRGRSWPADDVTGMKIKAPVRGGGGIEVRSADGATFSLAIPQGTGAFSRRDLEWLRERCLSALGKR